MWKKGTPMRKKQTLAVALLLGLILVLCSCSKSAGNKGATDLAGTWKLDFNHFGVKIEATVTLREGDTFTLDGEGSGYGQNGTVQIEGMYSVSGDVISFKPLKVVAAFNDSSFNGEYALSDAPSYSGNYEIDGDKLVFSIDKDSEAWKTVEEKSPVGLPVSSLEFTKESE